jgi:hypothetical protein
MWLARLLGKVEKTTSNVRGIFSFLPVLRRSSSGTDAQLRKRCLLFQHSRAFEADKVVGNAIGQRMARKMH